MNEQKTGYLTLLTAQSFQVLRSRTWPPQAHGIIAGRALTRGGPLPWGRGNRGVRGGRRTHVQLGPLARATRPHH
eukprot:1803632-Alexandrium_andersonii.AAC.1